MAQASEAPEGDTVGRLHELLRRLYPENSRVAISRSPQGLSSETFLIDVEMPGMTRGFVAKAARAGLMPTKNRDVLRQAWILRHVAPFGLLTPSVVAADEGAPPEVPPFFIMTRSPGDAADPGWPGDGVVANALVRGRALNMARALGSIHRVPLEHMQHPYANPVAASEELDRWEAVLHASKSDVQAQAERLCSRLRATVPAEGPVTLTHGDYRFGNLVFVDDQVSGIIDWELWAASDPRFDTANLLLYTSGESALFLRSPDALPSRDELMAAYEEQAAGTTVADMEWFMGALRFKSVAALSLLVRHNRRAEHPDERMEAVAERLRDLVA